MTRMGRMDTDEEKDEGERMRGTIAHVRTHTDTG